MNILELEKFEIGTKFKKIYANGNVDKISIIRDTNGISYENATEGEFQVCDFENLNAKYLEYKEYNKIIMGEKSKSLKLYKIFIKSIFEDYQQYFIIQKIKLNEDINIFCDLNNDTFGDGSPILRRWENPEEYINIICKLKKDSIIYFIYDKKLNCYYFYMNNIWHKTTDSIKGEIIIENIKKEDIKKERFKFNYNDRDYNYSSQNELYEKFLIKIDYDSVNITDDFIEIDLRNGNFIKIKLL